MKLFGYKNLVSKVVYAQGICTLIVDLSNLYIMYFLIIVYFGYIVILLVCILSFYMHMVAVSGSCTKTLHYKRYF